MSGEIGTGKRSRLSGKYAYLAGPMDRVPDGGVIWREQITPWLKDRLGVIANDPAKKPIDCPCGDETDREERRRWVSGGEWDKLTEFMKEVRGYDLRLVNESQFMILHVDPDVHMCGSYEELAIATHEKKPVIVHCPGGKSRIPWWLFAQVPHQTMFGSWDEAKNYLVHIHEDENIDTMRRWFFFNNRV